MRNVKVWQIYFREDQLPALDPAFTPINNTGANSPTLEFDVFQRLWRSNLTTPCANWAAVSWKFGKKTGLTGEELYQLLHGLGDTDLVYMNPFPKDEGLFESSWLQGEVSHPGLLSLARPILGLMQSNLHAIDELQLSSSYSTCNYFFGNARFWSSYIPFVEGVIKVAEEGLAPEQRSLLWSSDADWRGLHNGASFAPFFVERLLPIFLRSEGKGLRARQLKLPKPEAQLSRALIELREMKDIAILSGSGRLFERWKRARRDYALANFSPAWCARFLPALEASKFEVDE
jgi:hypothetical protein